MTTANTGSYEIFAPITKTEKTDDGDLIVWGKATGPDLDLDQQICDPGWLAKAMPAWYEWGNVRAQHSNVAAGVGIEMESTDSGDYYVKALIVDKDSINKVEKGVYKGYSIGITNGRLAKDKAAPKGRIVDGDIPELSLVDRPCNPTAKMGIAKAYGGHMAPMDTDGEIDTEATVKSAEATSDATEVVVEPEAIDQIDSAVEAPKAANPERPALILTPRAHKSAVALVEKVNAGDHLDAGVLLKSAGVNDESADIAGAWAAIGQIADLIISEAMELKTGRGEEIYDIKTLTDAVCSLRWFIYSEQEQDGKPAGDIQPDGDIDMAATAEIEKAAPVVPQVDDNGVETEPDYLNPDAVTDATKSAPDEAVEADDVETEADIVKTKWTQAKRDAAEKAGHAMTGGKYPIEDASDVEDAIGLVGNGAASKKKIRAHIMAQAKRVGASDKIPADWKSDDSAKSVEADLTKQLDASASKIDPVPTAALDESAVAEIVTKAVTKAVAPLKAELDSARDELAKVLAMPRPGGPVIIAPPQTIAAISNKSEQAARYRLMADQASDPGIASAYRAKAREVESTKD